MNTFFDEITTYLSKAPVKYENIIIMGDFNMGNQAPFMNRDFQKAMH